MKKAVSRFIAAVLIAAISLFCGVAAAQTYPTKVVRLIVPFPPSGSVDIVARLLAPYLTQRLGKQVIVENHPGAGAVLGTEMVANSEPDGYKLLIVSAAHTINSSLTKVSYDPVKSFSPVAKMLTGPGVLTIHPGVPASSLKELIALAKAKPGQLICSTAGLGTFNHLGAELLKTMANIDYKIVHFKGGAPAIVDQLGGHSQVHYGTLMQVLPHIKSGKLKALGTGGAKRSLYLPDVPTIAEAGVPGYEASQWWGIIAPAGTPKPVVDRIHKELTAILNMAEAQKQFLTSGAEQVTILSPADFSRFIAAETAKWAKVIREGNIKAE